VNEDEKYNSDDQQPVFVKGNMYSPIPEKSKFASKMDLRSLIIVNHESKSTIKIDEITHKMPTRQ